MATSSIPAWRIQWTKKPGGLQAMGLQRVEHDCVTKHACLLVFYDSVRIKIFNLVLVMPYTAHFPIYRVFKCIITLTSELL